MQSQDLERASRSARFRLSALSHYRQSSDRAKAPLPGINLEEVFSELLKGLERSFRFDYFGLGIFDHSTKQLKMALQAGSHEFPWEIPVLESSLGKVLDEQAAIEVTDRDTETRFPDMLELAREGSYRSFRIVPLSTSRQKLGVMGVSRNGQGGFSEHEVRHLDHAAQLMALVVENALMSDVLTREKSRLQALLNISTALVSSLNVQELFEAISRSIQHIMRQEYTLLALHDDSNQALRAYVLDSSGQAALLKPETPIPLDETASGVVFQEGKPKFFSYAELQAFDSEYVRILLAHGIRSVCSLPLISHRRKFGALGLARTQDDIPAEDDLALMTQIAAQVAMAVDNARAHEEIARFKDRLSKEKLYLEEEIRSQHNFGEVVGNSTALRQVVKQVEIAAPSEATVLVLGETGTGKELVARAVHRLSSRREGNFIKLNCAAIPTGLLESELFGHEKGAFTGAISQKIGRLELADKGTLFLDEIGEIPMELQPKLLRVLQDHEFERLGGIKTLHVNVRLVAATNRDLGQAVSDRQFRSDLYYRLNVFPIRLPPLRERVGDVPLLVRYFVQKFARRMGKRIESIPTELIRELEQWHWPGNIRELENFIERSVILTQDPVFYAPMAELRASSPDRSWKVGGRLEDVEREYILRTLRESGGVIAGVHGAAARLGMKRTTLQSRMQKLGITREEYEA